jgi:hypothetical protein
MSPYDMEETHWQNTPSTAPQLAGPSVDTTVFQLLVGVVEEGVGERGGQGVGGEMGGRALTIPWYPPFFFI